MSAIPTDHAWLHTLSPEIISFGDAFALRWYGVSYLLGFLAAYILLTTLAKRGFTPIARERLADAMLLLVAGVIVGGRLGYVVLYDPSLLVDFSGAFPFWGVLKLNQGGMASHGGFAGVVLAAWWIARGVKDPETGARTGAVPPLHVMDLCALVAPLGLMFGRLANFINGELLGRVAANPGQPGPWWSVRYPQEILERPLDTLPHTDQQLDQIVQLSLTRLLPGETDWYLGYERLVRALQRGDQLAQEQLGPLLSARYPTQLMQAFFDGLLVLVVVWFIARKPRIPGVVGAWMLIVYALGRIPMDLVRLPDAGIAQFGPLTRGQFYSLLMFLSGVVALSVLSRKKNATRMGGWATRQPPADAPSS